MNIITPERASEIRGELTEKYGATWLHHYHEAIEAEVLAKSPPADLLASCKEGWRHADELDQDRKRLAEINADLLDALQDMVDNHEDACTGYGEGAADKARAAIAKAKGINVQHLPSDDTEGGEV